MRKKSLGVKNDIGYFKSIRIPLLEMVYSMVDQFLYRDQLSDHEWVKIHCTFEPKRFGI